MVDQSHLHQLPSLAPLVSAVMLKLGADLNEIEWLDVLNFRWS